MKTIQIESEQETQRQKPRIANPVRKTAGRKQARVKNRGMTCLNSGQEPLSENGAAAVKLGAPAKILMKPKKLTPRSKLKLKQSAEVKGISLSHETAIQIIDEPAEAVPKPEVSEVCKMPEAVVGVIDKPAETVHKPAVNSVRNGIIGKIMETYQSLKYGSRLLTEELENLLIKKHSHR